MHAELCCEEGALLVTSFAHAHCCLLGMAVGGKARPALCHSVQVNGYKIASALLGQLQMPRLYVWVRSMLCSKSQGCRELLSAAIACLVTASTTALHQCGMQLNPLKDDLHAGLVIM